jgi:hypothetical protein
MIQLYKAAFVTGMLGAACVLCNRPIFFKQEPEITPIPSLNTTNPMNINKWN